MIPSPPRSVTLVLGGARSGKSMWALQYVETNYTRPLYLATAEPNDEEMLRRIRNHRRERSSRWQTLEQPLDIEPVLTDPTLGADAILVDCLTLWVANVLLKLGANQFEERERSLMDALGRPGRPVVVVSNEVGLGVVPPTGLGREYRDLLGRLNQRLAALADRVVFMVAGLPLPLKGCLQETEE